MPKYLIRKLEQFTVLSTEDKAALDQAARHVVRQVGIREDIIREGDVPRYVHLILEGFACRYKTLEDGRRQIVAFLVPGDMSDPRMVVLSEMDHSIAALSPVTLALLTEEQVLALTDHSGRLTRALWWSTMVEEAIAREWIVNLGQRVAVERLAHLFCELFIRLRIVGLTRDNTCELPITQTELADATGMTPVHTNRTLQELRGMGLITLKGGTLEIRDFPALKNLAMFNPSYLHVPEDQTRGWRVDPPSLTSKPGLSG